MLSDEMTTGSLNSSDDVRRAYAARSHEWNLTQPRFREAFSEVGTARCSLFVLYSPCLIWMTATGHHTLLTDYEITDK
jgi:hypothetical protein